MTKTEELLRLADAAIKKRDYFMPKEITHFRDAANPTTVKQLVELCRLQHSALWHNNYRQREEAIAAFERFEKGE